MERTKMTDDLSLKSLESFIGTTQYWKVLGVMVTDGVKYIMDNGYSWFVTDAIPVLKFGPRRVKQEPFVTVELKLDVDNPKEADLYMTDGNYNKLYKQHYGYTDAKRDLKLFYTDNVIMLSSEY